MRSAPEWMTRRWRREPQWREQIQARFNLRCNRASRPPPVQPYLCCNGQASSPPSPHHFTAGGQLQEGWEQGMSVPAVICENQDSFSQRTKLSNSSLNYEQSIICHISIHKSFVFNWLYVCSGAFCSLQIRYNIH